MANRSISFFLDDAIADNSIPLMAGAVAGSIVLLIAVAIFVFLVYYQKKMTCCFGMKMKIVLEDNSIYESEAIEKIIRNTPISPDWLLEKQEMIFPLDSIEKNQELGKGQYGSVFKGKLVQGKAVYVTFALNYYFTSVIDKSINIYITK